MGKRLKESQYGLSIALATLFVVSWIGQFFTQLAVVKDEATEHGQSFEWGSFWADFGQATFENWQSEFLQLLTFVLLTAMLIHKGSHESKDSSDRQEAKIDQILTKVGGDKPRPYPPTGLTTAKWKALPTQMVPVNELVLLQEQLSTEGLLNAASGGETYTKDPFPHVVRYQGTLYVEDGHHRVAVAKVHGDAGIEARVFEVA